MLLLANIGRIIESKELQEASGWKGELIACGGKAA